MGFKRKKKRNGVEITPFSSEGSELLGAFLQDLQPMHQDTIIPEYQFFSERGWRADYSIPRRGILFEYEGLPSRYNKSRHTTRAGYVKDIEKYNKAATLGLVVLRYHWDNVSLEQVGADLESILETRLPDRLCATCEHPFCSFLKGAMNPIDKDLLPEHIKTHSFFKCQVCCYSERKAKEAWVKISPLFSSRSPNRIKFEGKGKAEKKEFYAKGQQLLDLIFLKWGVWEEKLKENINLEELIALPDKEKMSWIEKKIAETLKKVEDMIGWPPD